MGSKVLIVGGGISGMCCAIQLAKQGADITLIDLDPAWRVYGAGITITGPTYRAFGEIGLADEVMAGGYPCIGTRTRLADGTLLEEHIMADVPIGAGILRPILHSILSQHTRAAGVTVRLGLTVDALESDGDGTNVRFSDGGADRFDLVIGADGIVSRVRDLVFPEAPRPRLTGQGAWRVLAPRPPEIDAIEVYLGASIKAGITPVSADQLYLFALSPESGNTFIDPGIQASRLREILADFGGDIGTIRDSLDGDSPIIYRPLQTVLVPAPWHRNRIVLVGDAAHATTPHLASGAGAAVEDAVVLAEEMATHETIDEALVAFSARRYDRCRDVIETSLKLGEMELTGAPADAHAREYGAAMMRLTAPI